MANYTPNYQLHQWEPQDPFLRTDFNQDLSKIDTALDTLTDKSTALEAAITAAAAGAGNCEMELITYIGTGTKGSANPTRISFTQRPDVFFIVGDLAYIMGRGGVAEGIFTCRDVSISESFVTTITGTWSGSQVSYYNDLDARYQMNSKNKAYWALALHRKIS